MSPIGPSVHTTIGFASLAAAQRALRALAGLGITPDQVTMAVTNRDPKTASLLSLEKMAGRQLPLAEILAKVRLQGGIDLEDKIGRLEHLYRRSGLVFSIRSAPAQAAGVVYVLTAAALPGGVIVPPPLSRLGELDKALSELAAGEGATPVAVVIAGPERAAQALQALDLLGETGRVRLYAHDAGVVRSLIEDNPQVHGEVLADSRAYPARQALPDRSRPAVLVRQALDAGGVVVELDPSAASAAAAIHVLTSYGLPGGVIIPPPLPPRPPKPKK